jgi:peptidoglycan/LPS O-acetylase OafA/YrhL
MAFTAFWYGIVHIWRTYGAAWGLGATLSALGLSFAFVVSGLLMSSSDIEEMRSKIRDRFGGDG